MIRQDWQTCLQQSPSQHPATESAPGLVWLDELGVASFAGPDVARFLQGYLTCDTTRLAPARAQAAALCSLKGRVIANGWCTAPTPDEIRLIVHRSLVPVVQKHLQMYLRFSKTRFTDASDDLLVFGGLDLPPDAGGLAIDDQRQLFLCDRIDAAVALHERWGSASANRWADSLISAGIALTSAPVSDMFLPQMLDLTMQGAVDFAKGCYLGQEIVARAQHRGQVKRRLQALAWQGTRAPTPGDELSDTSGAARGIVIQSVTGSAGTGRALAVLQVDAPLPLHHGDTRFDTPV